MPSAARGSRSRTGPRRGTDTRGAGGRRARCGRCVRAGRIPSGRRGRGRSTPSSRIECSTSAFSITQPVTDRGVGADVAVGERRAGADHRRPADDRALQARARLDDHPPVDLRLDQLALDRRLDRVEHEPVGGEHVLELAGVLPPAPDDVRLDPPPAVEQVLDRVGDLELAARRGLDRPGGVVDTRREHVHAAEGEVGLRLWRLLDEPDDLALARARRPRSSRGRGRRSAG